MGVTDFPWFPFWVDDFTNARRVKLMSLDAIGLYTLLLCEQWKEGPIPNDIEAIARLCRRDSDAIGDAWNEVRPCFTETPEGLVNHRLEEERRKQETKRKRYQKAGKKGAEKRWAQGDNSDAIGDASKDAKENPKTESESESDTDKKETPPIGPPEEKSPPRKRRSQVPDGYTPTEAHLSYADEHGLDLEKEVPAFIDYHRSKGNVFLDHDRALSTWLRKAVEYGRGRPDADKPEPKGMTDDEWAADIERRRRELEESHAT